MHEFIQLIRHERHGATFADLRLNRPEKGNALNRAMLAQFAAAVAQLADDPRVRAVVLRGAGRFFCTGGDIAEWGALTPSAIAENWIVGGIEAIDTLARLPQPVIAAVHGPAIGGGLELILRADLRIATAAATFATPEVGLGMIAGWGGVRRLAETIGIARARHLTLLGSPIDASRALAWGLVTELADTPAEMDQRIEAWLDRLLANSPSAMALTKGLLADWHADARRAHADAAAAAKATADCAEGIIAFREKRRPIFRDRAAAAAPFTP